MSYTIIMTVGGQSTRGAQYDTEREVCEAIQTAAELARRNGFRLDFTYEENDGTLYSELANKAVAQWPTFEADYNRRNDLGHIKNEDYAPLATLCAKIWQEWLASSHATMEDYERGVVYKIMLLARPHIKPKA